MNTHSNRRDLDHNGARTTDRRSWRRAVIVGAALAGIVATHGATAGADARDTGPARNQPVWEQVAARQELRRTVDMMPAGWPATEAMRRQAEQPLGDAAQRAKWRETADRMPAGWPATEAMQAELAR